jgi:hypothetical protein
MFKGLKINLKKSSKKAPSKKSDKDKERATLETTRGSELMQSFLERFKNFGIEGSSGSKTYEYLNTSECI